MPYNEQMMGFMPLIDLQTLELLASRVPPNGTIIEVGSFLGRSAWTLAKSCHPSVTVYCIDTWDPVYLEFPLVQKLLAGKEYPSLFEEFMKNVKDCPNIIPIKGESTKIPWPKKYGEADLVFIDADHQSPNVDNDIHCWIKRLKPSGILSGHDFSPYAFPDVCRAVIRTARNKHLPLKMFGKGFIWAIELDSDLYPHQGWIPSQALIDRIIEVINNPEPENEALFSIYRRHYIHPNEAEKRFNH